MEKPINILEHNRAAWNQYVKDGNEWTTLSPRRGDPERKVRDLEGLGGPRLFIGN
jgi:hypothetical protein